MIGIREFPVYGVVLLTVAAARAAAPSGVYSGSYTCAQRTIPLQLTVNAVQPGGAIVATVTFEPPSSGRSLEFHVTGSLATSNRFVFLPTRWETRPAPGIPMFGLQGVYDPASETLTGKVTSRPCEVTLQRDAAKTEAIHAETKAREQEIQTTPQSAASAGKPPEACLALLRWASRVAEEYADTYKADTVDQLRSKLLNLYADDYFAPFFGKPVDQMTLEDMAPVHSNIGACTNSPRFGPQFHVMLMSQIFLNFRATAGRGEQRAARGARQGGRVGPREAADDRRTAIFAQRRRVRDQFHDAMKQLNGMPASADAYPQAVALEKSGRTVYAVLWPSELKAFEAASAGAIRRSGEPLLVSRVNAALAAAKTRDQILKLDQVAAANQELYRAVGPEIAKREDDRLAAALHQGLVGLMAGERKRIDSLGSGIASLEAGAAWYKEFNVIYLRVSNDEAVKTTMAHFSELRSHALSAAATQVVSAIQKTANEAELKTVESRYVIDPDRAVPAAKPIVDALVDKRWQVARDIELQKFSDWERKHMIANTTRIDVDNEHIPPPTDRDVGLAFLRSYAHNGGRITGPNTVTYGLGLGLAAAVFELKNSKVQQCVEKDGHYDCRYLVWIKISPSEGMNEFLGKSIQADMLNSWYSRLNSLEPKPTTDSFHVEITGCVSPTRDRKIQADALSYWEGFMDDVKSAGCAARVARGDRTAIADPGCAR